VELVGDRIGVLERLGSWASSLRRA